MRETKMFLVGQLFEVTMWRPVNLPGLKRICVMIYLCSKLTEFVTSTVAKLWVDSLLGLSIQGRSVGVALFSCLGSITCCDSYKVDVGNGERVRLLITISIHIEQQ
jgi:hypothetical protein